LLCGCHTRDSRRGHRFVVPGAPQTVIAGLRYTF